MVSRDERRIARELVDAKRAREGQRTRQVPHISVELDNGQTAGLVDAATDATDARALSEEQADQIGDLTDISDASTVENTFLPERMAPGVESAGAAFEVAVAAAGRVDEAQAAADAAMDAAARSERTALGLARRFGETEPEAPEGGWPVGAEWVKTVAGVPREVFVWDGAGWVHAQYLADEILIPGADGAIRLGDSTVSAPNMAAGALDAYTVNALQMYGGYIEAPVIASSDKLGSGANVLNDPEFASTVDSSWVVSGHLGDPAVSQRDSVSWDQTWTKPAVVSGTNTFRNYGNATADLVLTPPDRVTGSLLFANYSWLNATARSISNPYVFSNLDNAFAPSHGGGENDPSFTGVLPRTPGVGVHRTSRLTNSAVISVNAGDRWNIRASFTGFTTDTAPFITAIAVEVVATDGSVIWSRELDPGEKVAGRVNTWWEPTFSESVRFRISATYTAAGGTISRSYTPGSWARQLFNGAMNREWFGSGSTSFATYGAFPSASFFVNPQSAELHKRATTQLVVTSALMAKVEPQKGWRLTEGGGLELFNSLGAKTGNIDGENNFLAGRFATADSGLRWEVQGERIAFFDATNTVVGGMRRAGGGIQIFGPISYEGDTDWVTIPLLPEFEVMSGVTPRYRVVNGTLYLRGRVRRKTGADLGTTYTAVTPAGAIPDLAGIRDSSGSSRSVPGSGVSDEGLVRIADNGSVQCAARAGVAFSFLTADWLIG